MKLQLRKWSLRLFVTALLVAGLLLIIILNPTLTYAHKTTYNNYTVYHNQPLDPEIKMKLDEATQLLKASEFYNPKLQLDICLNDGSKYPALIKKLRGQAFAWGFYNKVVLQGTANFKKNYIELNGYKWNLTQLLAHEITHCLQFDKLGFWKSNPVADIPGWKWEGYAEYVARGDNDQKDLSKNITRLMDAGKDGWEIKFSDSTIAPREYYNYWLLVMYCLDVKRMTYKQLIKDATKEETIMQEMMCWYQAKQ